MKKIILASGSPRRKQLLELAEIPFEIKVANTDESFPADLSPSEVAEYIARVKAQTVRKMISEEDNGNGHTILAADTVVILENEFLGKPSDEQEAINILSKLSGKSHEVITGVVILTPRSQIVFSETTKVRFYPLSDEAIRYYVKNYKPFDKAGAYAIQEWIGAIGIQSITGDFYNVMGLPISRVVQELRKLDERD